MKFLGKNIQLRSSDDQDYELNDLIDNAEELYNMSETRLYPDNLPLEMKFRIEHKDDLIGEIKLSRIRWYNRKAEVGLILKKEFQSKGYGSEALKLILDYAFNKMNLHRIEAEVIEFNEHSQNLLEKFNFVKEGTLREAKYSDGKYWNIYRFGLLKSEYEKLYKEV